MNRVITNTGLPSAVQQLTCVGDATPIPDWDAYASIRSRVPSAVRRRDERRRCSRTRSPTVTLVDPHYQASRRCSADLNWSGWVLEQPLQPRRRRQLRAQPRSAGRDRSELRADERFALADEGGRPVFVAADEHRADDGRDRVGRRARVARASRASRASARICDRTRSRSPSACRPTTFNSNFTWNASYTRIVERAAGAGLHEHRRQSARHAVGRQRHQREAPDSAQSELQLARTRFA